MRWFPFILLQSACYIDGDIRTAPNDTGPDTGQEGAAENDPNSFGSGSRDSGEPSDSGDSGDTGDTDTSVPVTTGEACYLGPQRDHRVCLPVVSPDPLPVGYDYPSPLSGSAQYVAPLAFLDLDAVDEQTRLAPNFVLEETAQAWKGRYGVVQPHAIERLQDLRDALGALVVNSGYRSPEYNAGVGGATHSRHMFGDAFDLDPISVGLDALEAECRAQGAGYVGVYATHIHCDWRNDPLSVPFFGGTRRSVHSPAPVLDGTILRNGRVLSAPAIGWDEGEPLREWRAFSTSGALLAEQRGQSFRPPAGTARVEVVIGRALTRRVDLGG